MFKISIASGDLSPVSAYATASRSPDPSSCPWTAVPCDTTAAIAAVNASCVGHTKDM